METEYWIFDWDLLVDTLAIILSWPVIIGGLVVFFWWKYKSLINAKIADIAKTGPVKFQSRISEASQKQWDLLERELDRAKDEARSLESKLSTSDPELMQAKSAGERLLKEYEKNTSFWKKQFLTRFLITDARNTLRFINKQSPLSSKDFDDQWVVPRGLGHDGFNEVIKSLIDYDLIVFFGSGEDSQVMITDFGRDFLADIGTEFEKGLFDTLRSKTGKGRIQAKTAELADGDETPSLSDSQKLAG